LVAHEYVPELGDLIWVDFNPQAEREQPGRRPAVVLSPRAYNYKTSSAIVCPITSHAKGYPFEVPVPAGQRIGGVILSDHLKSIAWRQRNAEKAGKISSIALGQVRDRVGTLLGIV
jgi:mRNA interferase MazF